ncbi:MAG: hypothetical protein U0792_15215 [Gemmataceae bacterium]
MGLAVGVVGCASKRELWDKELATGKMQGDAIRGYLDLNATGNGPGATQADADRMLTEFNRHQTRISKINPEAEQR